jgi:hypothetical protein
VTSNMCELPHNVPSSMLFLRLHSPVISSLTGPYIFHNTFLSKTINLYSSIFLSGHVSKPYYTTCRIKNVYNCFFILRDTASEFSTLVSS